MTFELSHQTTTRKDQIFLTFVGFGEVLCSVSTIIFGFWAFQSDYNRFKASSGIHIWSGGEVFVIKQKTL